jgi:hypothetical protein
MPLLNKEHHHISSSLKQPENCMYAVRVQTFNFATQHTPNHITIGHTDCLIVAAFWHDSFVLQSKYGKLNFEGDKESTHQQVSLSSRWP